MQNFSNLDNYYKIAAKLGFSTKYGSTFAICNFNKKEVVSYYSRAIAKDFSFRLKEHFETKNKRKQVITAKVKSIALTQHPDSNIYLFDIDTHTEGELYLNSSSLRRKIELKKEYKKNAKKIQDRLEIFFGAKSVFFEYSKYNNGMHFYISFTSKVPFDIIDILKTEIHIETGKFVNIDLRTEKKAVRLPFSNDYSNFLHKRKITAIEIFLKSNIQTANLELFISQLKTVGYVLNEKIDEINKNDNESIFTRHYYQEFLLQEKTQQNYKPLNDFSIYAGQRCKMMIKIGFWCKANSMSLEEYCEIIENNNVSSKDLTKWSHNRILEECKKIYNWIDSRDDRDTITRPEKQAIDKERFYSNTNYLTKQHKQIIYQLTREIYKDLYITRSEVKEKYKLVISIILKEMFGKAYLDMFTKREIRSDVALKAETKRKILESTQFPTLWLNRLKIYYNIENINVEKLYRQIRNHLLINEILIQVTNYCSTSNTAFSSGYKFSLARLDEIYKIVTACKSLRTKSKTLDPRTGKASLVNKLKQEKRIVYYVVTFLSSKFHWFCLNNHFFYPRLINSFET